MIDAILTNTVLPAISREFLTRTMAGQALNGVRLAVGGRRLRLSVRLSEAGRAGECAMVTQRCERVTDDRRELSLDEAMAIAILFQQQRPAGRGGRRSIARSSRSAPDHPDALHFSGVLAHQQGRSDEAIALIDEEPGARARPGRLAQQPRHRPAGARPTGRGDRRLSSARSRSIPSTPTRTTTSACCCGRRASRPRPKPRTARPSSSIPSTSTRITTSACC